MSTDDRLQRLADQTSLGEDRESLPLGLTLVSGAIAAVVLSPVLWLFVQGFDVTAQLSLTPFVVEFDANVFGALGELLQASTLDVLLNSLLLVIAVTAGSLVIGVPLAVLTVQTDLPFRRFWTVVCALPLVVPSYIGAFAFVSAFGPRGVLADLLEPLGIAEIPVIYGFEGAALVLTLFTYPYVFLTTRASLLSFDATQFEAARTLGHSPLAAFRRVTLPQILPGVTAGALLVALYALSDFGTPAIMHYDAFTRVIFVEYNTFARDFAALLSIQLLLVTVVILAIESQVGGGDTSAYVTRGQGRSDRVGLGWLKLPATLFCAAVAFLCLVVPMGVLVMWLFRSAPGYGAVGFEFEWVYGFNSVYVSVLAALAAVVLAVPVAYLSARTDSAITTVIDRATYVGYAAPGVVLGLALVFFGANFAPSLYQTLPLLVFAYVVRFLPQAVGTVRSSVLQVDPKLTEAARTLGHSPRTAFRKVTLPLIAPGVAAGAALVFLTTMKELPATLLLHPTGFDTLVTYIWLVQGAGYYGRAAVPALVLVGISALSMVVILARERYNG
ncbi:ABC transporter permease [Halospeciosus flavus]|uniref:ABC transporter permease n=1 Tax=Halospeciosus flavus TaxID=3032283 RepID=A0ABD5Z2I4_9EURY|nr:iron ABC transporter permease [Halospeciosus flavus]